MAKVEIYIQYFFINLYTPQSLLRGTICWGSKGAQHPLGQVRGLIPRPRSREPHASEALCEVRVYNRAGLLVPRCDNVYTFPPRTLQEYLSACYLTDQQDYLESWYQRLSKQNQTDGVRW